MSRNGMFNIADSSRNGMFYIVYLSRQYQLHISMLLYFPKIFLEICQNRHALSVRMREARRLMTEDRLSIKEVAARTGFSSQAYFSAAYRAFYGHPPSQSRNTKRA